MKNLQHFSYGENCGIKIMLLEGVKNCNQQIHPHIKKAPRRVLVCSSLIVQSPVDCIHDPDVENAGQVLVDGVLRGILKQSNENPVS